LTLLVIYGKFISDKVEGGKRMHKIIKACNFYVSEWHLFAALLPYVREELKQSNKVVIVSQDKLEKGMKSLVKRLNLHFENEKGIDEITWFTDEFVMEINEETNPITIVVQGSMEFIKEINSYLSANLQSSLAEIRIINCYEVYDTNTMLYNILDEHDFVFNTAGMNKKVDIFPGYIEPAKILNS
jgi:hypothetical protein